MKKIILHPRHKFSDIKGSVYTYKKTVSIRQSNRLSNFIKIILLM